MEETIPFLRLDHRQKWLGYDQAVEYYHILTGHRKSRQMLIKHAHEGCFETTPMFRKTPIKRASFEAWVDSGGRQRVNKEEKAS